MDEEDDEGEDLHTILLDARLDVTILKDAFEKLKPRCDIIAHNAGVPDFDKIKVPSKPGTSALSLPPSRLLESTETIEELYDLFKYSLELNHDLIDVLDQIAEDEDDEDDE